MVSQTALRAMDGSMDRIPLNSSCGPLTRPVHYAHKTLRINRTISVETKSRLMGAGTASLVRIPTCETDGYFRQADFVATYKRGLYTIGC